MKIRDIMTSQVACVNPETSVVETAQLMQKHDVGVIPVCQGKQVVGLVTDRDIVVRNIAHGKDPHTTPVKDVMTSQITTVNPDMSLNEAAALMAHQQIRRLPVVEDNQLIGIVALGDLATQAKYDVELARTLGEISTPSEPEQMPKQ
ncbi:MAG TPA: CBS domain-containing protein [Bacillota bacterium]|nr:CBS domain-containing protein [Bacillota bacterium]HPT88604.1 CBS domain-containing protein [Bacillota bacterium]